MLANVFVWTKMGAESGEALAAILRRKEFERQLGGGMFAWGIGNALGDSVSHLAALTPEPLAVFSPMPSRPKRVDVAPMSVLLWTAYQDAYGVVHPLPPHLAITSRGHAGNSAKARHYALFCTSCSPLTQPQPDLTAIKPAELLNLMSSRPLGASQVTAVVQRSREVVAGAREYPVAFTAHLIGPRYAKLFAPKQLSAAEIAAMAEAAHGEIGDWKALVADLRAADRQR